MRVPLPATARMALFTRLEVAGCRLQIQARHSTSVFCPAKVCTRFTLNISLDNQLFASQSENYEKG